VAAVSNSHDAIWCYIFYALPRFQSSSPKRPAWKGTSRHMTSHATKWGRLARLIGW